MSLLYSLALLFCVLSPEPIITLVDGLLEGDHCVADCLAKGNFGKLMLLLLLLLLLLCCAIRSGVLPLDCLAGLQL
jgi:hypothetical protein